MSFMSNHIPKVLPKNPRSGDRFLRTARRLQLPPSNVSSNFSVVLPKHRKRGPVCAFGRSWSTLRISLSPVRKPFSVMSFLQVEATWYSSRHSGVRPEFIKCLTGSPFIALYHSSPHVLPRKSTHSHAYQEFLTFTMASKPPGKPSTIANRFFINGELFQRRKKSLPLSKRHSQRMLTER